jgi:3-oxoacyl-[acyl-carrier-protein] synthase II
MKDHRGRPRVVVTGMGIVSPLGLGVAHVWKRLVNGESGLSAIQSFDLKDLPAKVAGQVPKGTKADGKLDLNEWIPIKDQKKMDRFIQLAIVAAVEAVEDSGWVADTEEAQCRTGVMIGSGIGGLETIQEAASLVQAGRTRLDAALRDNQEGGRQQHCDRPEAEQRQRQPRLKAAAAQAGGQ